MVLKTQAFSIPSPHRITYFYKQLLFLLNSYCNKLHCYKGRVGTKERKLTRLVSCTTPPTLPLITACVIYRYQRNGNGSQTNSSKLFFSGVGTEDFACDEKHLCNSDRMTTWTNNVRVIFFINFSLHVWTFL